MNYQHLIAEATAARELAYTPYSNFKVGAAIRTIQFKIRTFEELGLPQVDDIPDDALQDPTWERSGHTDRGRDGCRVPIPWTAAGTRGQVHDAAERGRRSGAELDPVGRLAAERHVRGLRPFEPAGRRRLQAGPGLLARPVYRLQ